MANEMPNYCLIFFGQDQIIALVLRLVACAFHGTLTQAQLPSPTALAGKLRLLLRGHSPNSYTVGVSITTTASAVSSSKRRFCVHTSDGPPSPRHHQWLHQVSSRTGHRLDNAPQHTHAKNRPCPQALPKPTRHAGRTKQEQQRSLPCLPHGMKETRDPPHKKSASQHGVLGGRDALAQTTV